MADPVPFFSDEMQLVAWRDSHTQGPTVTFRLASSEALEAFRAVTMAKDGKAGHRIAAVMVLIGDDELPQEPPKRPGKPGPLAVLAMQWCRDESFRKWLFDGRGGNESVAAQVVKDVCRVGSRLEIDSNPVAATAFNERVRAPYMEYLRRSPK